MTVYQKADVIREFYGLSTDDKPSDLVGVGHLFTETNTGLVWIWDGASWTEDLKLIFSLSESFPNVSYLIDGETTEILVGGGVGFDPVWTTATGSGAPVRAQGATIGDITAVTIRSIFDEDVEIVSDTLTANQCSGGVINNYGQTADAVLTLPAIAVGYNFTVVIGTTVAKYYRIDPNASDSIYLDGVTTGDGKYVGVVSAALGNAIQFVAVQTGASTYDWFATTVAGPWVAEA